MLSLWYIHIQDLGYVQLEVLENIVKASEAPETCIPGQKHIYTLAGFIEYYGM